MNKDDWPKQPESIIKQQEWQPNLTGKIRITLTDPEGRVLSDTEENMHSYLRNYWFLGYAQFWQTANNVISGADTGGTWRTSQASSAFTYEVNAAAGDNTFGIVVGTSSTAPKATDNKLGTIIAAGTGGGQLLYGAVSVGTPGNASDGSSSSITLTRQFTNNSNPTGPITINETGIYAKYSNNAYLFDIVRDTPTPQAVSGTVTATLTYTLSAPI